MNKRFAFDVKLSRTAFLSGSAIYDYDAKGRMILVVDANAQAFPLNPPPKTRRRKKR